MKLSELLNEIANLAKEKGITTPFICGGAPRDKLMGKLDAIADVDITTGDASIHNLAKEVSIKFASPNTGYKVLPDGHAQVTISGFKLDFSSNFIVPGIDKMLSGAGFKNPTDMHRELYSRDFTCNALLMSLDLHTIKDPLGLGIEDIKAKKLRTCLPAAITLGYDNKRIIRVIYLAAKLGFDVDDEIISWIKKNPTAITNSSDGYLKKKLASAIKYNKAKTVELLDLLGLWHFIPVVNELTPYMAANPERV